MEKLEELNYTEFEEELGVSSTPKVADISWDKLDGQVEDRERILLAHLRNTDNIQKAERQAKQNREARRHNPLRRKEQVMGPGEDSSPSTSKSSKSSTMTTGEKTIFHIEKLNNDNYLSWKFKMKMLLLKDNCFDTIELSESSKIDKDMEEKDQKALQLIALSVENSQLIHVKKAKGGREAWKNLKEYHQRSSLSNQVRIFRRLHSYKLKVGHSMRIHLEHIFEDLDELAEMEAPVDDKMAVKIILSSLNEDYDGLITALEAWDEGKLTMHALKQKLLEEFDRKVTGTGRREAERYNMAKRAQEDECFFCKKKGHFKRECSKYKEWLKNKENKESAKTARFGEWYISFLISNEKFEDWCIDSGSTKHVCGNKNLFTVFKERNGSVHIANGQKVEIKGEGKVSLTLNVSNKGKVSKLKVELNEVLYVPEIDGNLISVKKLTEKGYKIEFIGNKCFMKKDDESICIAEWDEGLYRVKCVDSCLKVKENTELCVHDWHRILGHRNLEEIKKMGNKGLKIKNCNCTYKCESCIKGKLSRKTFPKKASETQEILDCIVSDVCGPMQVQSIGRSRYFATFIDVKSGYTEVAFLKGKDEVSAAFIQYIEKIKTQFRKKPKIVRTDRGKEYLILFKERRNQISIYSRICSRTEWSSRKDE